MSTWASRIRDLQALGMTQQEIGEHIGLATSTVSDIANERSKAPGGEAAIKLHELHIIRCPPGRRISTAEAR
jgi:transcriptional regulator with XRE-family HTH domain